MLANVLPYLKDSVKTIRTVEICHLEAVAEVLDHGPERLVVSIRFLIRLLWCYTCCVQAGKLDRWV